MDWDKPRSFYVLESILTSTAHEHCQVQSMAFEWRLSGSLSTSSSISLLFTSLLLSSPLISSLSFFSSTYLLFLLSWFSQPKPCFRSRYNHHSLLSLLSFLTIVSNSFLCDHSILHSLIPQSFSRCFLYMNPPKNENKVGYTTGQSWTVGQGQ